MSCHDHELNERLGLLLLVGSYVQNDRSRILASSHSAGIGIDVYIIALQREVSLAVARPITVEVVYEVGGRLAFSVEHLP